MTTAYLIGDSYSVVGGGFGASLAARMGWTLTVDGVGGSGYGVAGSGTAFPDRLPALIAANPDVAIIEGGGNDWSANATPLATFITLLASFYASLRSSLPTATLYVTGAHRIGQTYFDALVSATATAGGVYVDWGDVAEVPRTTIPANTRWLTGTGNASAPAGDGNRDVYLGSDSVHPNAAGCAYLGTRLAFAINPPATGLDY